MCKISSLIEERSESVGVLGDDRGAVREQSRAQLVVVIDNHGDGVPNTILVSLK